MLLATNSPTVWIKGRHTDRGNFGMADGSVQPLRSAKLQQALVATGMATNRFAMP